MKLIEFKDWQLKVSEEVWGLTAFKKLLKRDKTKEKEMSFLEVLFIFHFVDVRSDYIQYTNMEQKKEEIKKDIGLPDSWDIDKELQEAIDVYVKLSRTTIQRLYEQTLRAASAVGDQLENSEELLGERDSQGKPIHDVTKILNAIEKVPKVMRTLQLAYDEVIKEQEIARKNNIGSTEKNIFEDGI